jgi:ssDNA-binding Zn-finger/Zn-ribbon topoisomerase 1
MTHVQPKPEHEGTLSPPEPSTRTCRTCGAPMQAQLWESSCGGYEDSKYTCPAGHVEWVDGIDS